MAIPAPSGQAGQWGGPLHAVRGSPQAGAGVAGARGGVRVPGGSVGDNLLSLVFCVHGVSGQDTAHHVPGALASGEQRSVVRWAGPDGRGGCERLMAATAGGWESGGLSFSNDLLG